MRCSTSSTASSRTFASTAFAPARGHALDILTFEKGWRIDFESWLNNQFFQHDWLGVFGSYWYATTHYLVTLVVLIWLYRHSASQYVTARRALVLALLAGLTFYLADADGAAAARRRRLPRYPEPATPTSGGGAQNGSAPKGLGNVTNELAAFPSLHAGWALWVAIVLIRAGVPKIVQALGRPLRHHDGDRDRRHRQPRVLDAVVGWVVILLAFGVAVAWERKGPTLGRDAYVLPPTTSRATSQAWRASQSAMSPADDLALILGQEVARAHDHVQRLRHRERRLHGPTGRVSGRIGSPSAHNSRIGPVSFVNASTAARPSAAPGSSGPCGISAGSRRAPSLVDSRERCLVHRDDLRAPSSVA